MPQWLGAGSLPEPNENSSERLVASGYLPRCLQGGQRAGVAAVAVYWSCMHHSDSPRPLVFKRPFEAEGTNQALEQAPALEALRLTEMELTLQG